MGKPDASEDELRVAAEAASCEEFVARLPRGWDTPAGEADVQSVQLRKSKLRNKFSQFP